jgi:hypothetical protein
MDNKKRLGRVEFMISSVVEVITLALLLFGFSLHTAPISAIAGPVDKSVNSTDTTISSSNSNGIPNAKSVFDTGRMLLPASVSGFIIYIPDEAHHPLNDNKTISLKNAHYIPSNLVIPSGTAIAFVHGDPQHIHVEILKDSNTGNVAWQTIAVTHPGGSDIKALSPGSYTVSDQKYAPMNGNVTVEKNVQLKGNLVVGGFFVPTPSLQKYKSDFTAAGFQVLSEHNFSSNVVQKDIAGPTTLLIYSTTIPIQDAITNLKPIIASLPYR